MDKKIAGLLGAVAAVTTMAGAQAATQQTPSRATGALRASSYADLLTPVPNATDALIADNEVLTRTSMTKAPAGVQLAYDHHHHHHHVIVIRRHHRHHYYYHHHHHHYYYHHHHHHHHSGAYIGVPGVGGVVVR